MDLTPNEDVRKMDPGEGLPPVGEESLRAEAAEAEGAAEAEAETPAAAEPERTPESVRKEIRRTRHRKELPLYFFLSIAGFIAMVINVLRALQDEGLINEIKNILEGIELGAEAHAVAQVLDAAVVVLSIVGGFGAVIGLLIVTIVMVYRLYGEEMAYSIRVSEKNFPEIYEKVQEYTRLLGWKREPEVYVQQMNGEMNAFTSWVPGKVFVHLNAEIVDIAYMEHKDLDTVCFVMAHEFGHAYLHHVQMYYAIWPVLANFIPGIGQFFLMPMFQRSREYSADRVGQALTGGKNERECMMLLAAGRHAYKYMDLEDYMQRITTRHNPAERFARWLTNMLASHPIMPFRTKAILDPEKKSGRLL